MIPVSLFRLTEVHLWDCTNQNIPFQWSISSCRCWVFRLVLTPSVSTMSTLPFASSSICLWILRIASKLRRAFSSLHSGSSMRQKSVGETESYQEGVKATCHVFPCDKCFYVYHPIWKTVFSDNAECCKKVWSQKCSVTTTTAFNPTTTTTTIIIIIKIPLQNILFNSSYPENTKNFKSLWHLL